MLEVLLFFSFFSLAKKIVYVFGNFGQNLLIVINLNVETDA